MSAALAAAAVDRRDVRLVVVDPARDAAGGAPGEDGGGGAIAITGFAALPALLGPGDVVVVNDAATLPASLRGTTARGEPVEIRLIPPVTGPQVAAVLFGAGDHQTPTEHRPPPPALAPGDVVTFAGDARSRAVGEGSTRAAGDAPAPEARLTARVVAIAGRQATLLLDRDGDALWQALYAAGRPVQYAHRAAPLPLWAVQTAYAARPWSAEMPSAGRPLTWDLLLALRRRGVTLAALTHGAGLSSTGDPALDAALPGPEPYDLPAATVAAVERARRHGGRVIAIGTTVVRALEAAALRGPLTAGPGIASLVITPAHALRVVDGIVSGLHGPDESHFRLLGALAPRALLDRALARAAAAGLNGHELGDACLVARGVLRAPRAG